ncbi:RNA polymerase sigma factor [Rossellomorea sp. NS-SX7]|uniref:RNA polymerase sigma factor n=1 Tax=Rossellomorea sp. NS-SX7 TaxID=3463856 RepID=UPI00405A0252
MDEFQLIEKAKQGDLSAYSKLISDYSPIVERFAYQMGNNLNDIPDISQEVFIRVYRFIDGFTHAKFTTWLYKITLNVSRDFKRKESQHNKRVHKVMNEPVYETAAAHVSVLREEEDRVLHECIQELEEKYRAPIILYYFHEKKYEEIADILSVNLSTIKTRILRGKSLLKKLLEEAEKGEGTING